MALVTVFCPLTTTGAGELVVQTSETRFVVDCNVKLMSPIGQLRITFCCESIIVNGGRVTGTEMPNTEPSAELPP